MYDDIEWAKNICCTDRMFMLPVTWTSVLVLGAAINVLILVICCWAGPNRRRAYYLLAGGTSLSILGFSAFYHNLICSNVCGLFPLDYEVVKIDQGLMIMIWRELLLALIPGLFNIWLGTWWRFCACGKVVGAGH